jgi:hypothetical protein
VSWSWETILAESESSDRPRSATAVDMRVAVLPDLSMTMSEKGLWVFAERTAWPRERADWALLRTVSGTFSALTAMRRLAAADSYFVIAAMTPPPPTDSAAARRWTARLYSTTGRMTVTVSAARDSCCEES